MIYLNTGNLAAKPTLLLHHLVNNRQRPSKKIPRPCWLYNPNMIFRSHYVLIFDYKSSWINMNPSLSLDEKWWPQFHPFKRRTILVVNLYMIINQVSLKEICTQTSTYMLHFNFKSEGERNNIIYIFKFVLELTNVQSIANVWKYEHEYK